MENPTSDEKVLAALAHASVLFAFFGPVGPTLVWVFQRNKSKYVRYHALQAMGYQALAFWLFLIGVFVVVFGGALIMAAIGGFLIQIKSADPELLPLLIQPLIILSMFGLIGIFVLIGIAAGVFCVLGRDFNYPLIGRWLKGKILGEQITAEQAEEWEDNWVGGICHSTAIIQFWGVITPLIVWFSQKERSPKLRLQALQAAVFQFTAIAAYIVGMVAYLGMIFLMVAGLAVFGLADPASSTTSNLSPLAGILFAVFFVIIMLFWLLIMIAAPIYYILAAVASILTIRGNNFK